MKPHLYHPNAGEEIRLAGDQAEQFAGDTTATTSSSSTPPEPTVNVPLLVAIAKDEAEVYRRHCASVVKLWDALGVYGFVCRDQARVAEWMELLSLLRGVSCK